MVESEAGDADSRDQSQRSDCIDLELLKELRRIALRTLQGERSDHTLQATALVHEAWLKLQRQADLDPRERARYLAAGAQAMRRILIDHARSRLSLKRGGKEVRRATVDAAEYSIPDPRAAQSPLDIVVMDEALERMADVNGRAVRVVELRFYGGLTHEEISRELGVSIRTVENDWRFARQWLRAYLARGG